MIYVDLKFISNRQLGVVLDEWKFTVEELEAHLGKLEAQALSRIKAKINFDLIKEDYPLLETLVSSYLAYKMFNGSNHSDWAEGKIEDFYALLTDIEEAQAKSGILPIETEDGTPARRGRFL